MPLGTSSTEPVWGPHVSRDTLSLRADFLLFFRLGVLVAVSRRSCVL